LLRLYGVGDVWMSMQHWEGKADEVGEKPVHVTLCVPQIPLALTWDWTWASALRFLVHNRLFIPYFTLKCHSNGRQDYKWCIPWPITQAMTLPRRSLISKCHTVSWYMRKYNIIYANKESRDISAPIFTTFTSALCADLLTEVKMGVSLSPLAKYGFHYIDFHKHR
jgi:hypothetical protein